MLEDESICEALKDAFFHMARSAHTIEETVKAILSGGTNLAPVAMFIPDQVKCGVIKAV